MVSRRQKVFADQKSLERASAALAQTCRIMRLIHRRNGTPPLRDYAQGFEGLAKIVTGQQLSAQSAAAIWTRVAAAVQPFTAKTLLSFDDRRLASLGLSNGKIRTLHAIANEITTGTLDFDTMPDTANEAIHERLTAIHGVGPWTADIYLLFSLRRADAFPAGDLALQIAAQKHFRLLERPSPAKLLELSERWRPFRGAAARLLWADYAAARAALRAKMTRKNHPTPASSRKD